MTTVKHDRQDAVEKATDLFWANGFHATSMRNIQQAVDMRPGSIYASFGSKEGLFKETLQHYARASQARLNDCIAASTSPLEGLKLFIRDSVIGSRTSAPSDICMLVKTIAELTNDNAELLSEAKGLLQQVEVAFAAILVQAQEQGEINRAKTPERMARYLQVQLMGLRAYARANEGDAQVIELIDDVFDSLHG